MMRRVFQIAWPAFLAAGVLEMLVFAVIDPNELHWFGGVRIDWSAQAVYTFTFLLFWGAIASASAMAVLLVTGPDLPETPPSSSTR